MEAGNVWGDDLRATCHSLAAQWYLLAAPGTWHKGDHERVLSHLAAIPIALKMELRDKRDIRELKGLLSQQDLGRVLTAESMSSHCLDVIKAYYIAAQCRPEALSDPSELITDYRKSIKYELRNIEIALCRCKFLKAYPIAPSFMVLLRTILGIWFICLPFVLAETTGMSRTIRRKMTRASFRELKLTVSLVTYISFFCRLVFYPMGTNHCLWIHRVSYHKLSREKFCHYRQSNKSDTSFNCIL